VETAGDVKRSGAKKNKPSKAVNGEEKREKPVVRGDDI